MRTEAASHPSNPPAPTLIPHWYAVYTRACHERAVADHLVARGVEHYLPQYQVVRRWKNRRTMTLELPLFPAYLFVHIASAERVRVLEVPSVLKIVGSGRDLLSLRDEEIEILRAGLEGRKAEPHPFLKVGQKVRIRAGAMAGLEGILLRKKNSLRVVINLDLIMKSVAVEVDGEEVEPLGPVH